MSNNIMTGRSIYLLYYMLIKQQPILPSTGVSPFELMFGRCAHKPLLNTRSAHDITSYQDQLRIKLAYLYDFVEVNNVEASDRQKHQFNKNVQSRTFIQGDPVWLSIPTGKLDPKWEAAG